MRYLFFDIESASSDDGGHMCSFGYVLTDAEFNILETKDIYMNPECEFDPYVEKNILDFPKSHYESFPPFPDHYYEIKRLFQDCIAVGHAVDNDAYYLFNEIERNGLDQIEYHFIDTALIHVVHNPDSYGTPSLKSLCQAFGLEEQEDTHQSVIDARLTMEVFRKQLEIYSISLEDERYTGYVESNDIVVSGASYFNSLEEWHNNEVYKFLLKNHGSKQDGPLKGKWFAMSEAYENTHYKEVIYIVDKILSLGGSYTRSATRCTVFIDEKSIRKIREINYRLSQGASIEVMNLERLQSLIGYKEEEVDQVVCSIEDEYYNYEDGLEYEEAGTSLGNLFGDFFKK